MDKDLFYISMFLIFIGGGGQLAWFFFAVHGGVGGQPTQASFQELQNVTGYALILGLIILPAGLFKDGLPIPGYTARVFIGILLVLTVGIAFTGVLLSPSAQSSSVKPETFLVILAGSQTPGTKITFSPQNITVVIGVNNTVQWTNNDQAVHTITSSASPPVFNSGTVLPGQKFVYTFTQPGTYNYICTLHPGWMHGTVTVKLS